MTFSLPHAWVWDFWTAVDKDTVHLFYLHAPKSLNDPELRHRNASIGHATSTDCITWTDHGTVLEHGPSDAPDASATWTGSVIQDDAGLWRMYYTGSQFPDVSARLNQQTILMAASPDLHHWTKNPQTLLEADPTWYETLADQTWHEQAWRDPWLVPDPAGNGWHMLITARARHVPPGTDPRDRAVIGHAHSADLTTWTARPPLSAPGAGFAHLEVLQLVRVDDREFLVFSCDGAHLAGAYTGQAGGIWGIPIPPAEDLFGPAAVSLEAAYRITGEELYAGRLVQTPSGPVLLGFENLSTEGEFIGQLSDPIPLRLNGSGQLVAAKP
ncbi:glycosyl hydrolase family 32 [Streptomyces sp. NPDC091280]|uniref:glycosyl hydrolase family 32 n=1 Tax=Streptomyces sp. NPDC091280 TaxID=3365984 RepID=UPI00382A53BD